jgi:hypothetical protein
VVQSTCTLSGGDSGGPLVNEAGEVVGLNDFVVPDRNISGSAAFFHVELKHLQELVKDAPTSAMRVVPSPWATAARAFLGDVDGDGRNDTLTLKGRGPLPVAIFVDPSQATSAGANARAVFDAKEFSVPVTISTAAATRTVQVGDVLYLFNGQATVAAFTMKGTTATPLPKEKWPASPFMLAAAADEARLKRIMPVVAPAQVVDGSEPAFLVPPTSPTKVADSVDLDGDDLIDAVAQETLLGVTLYVDPNSKLPAGEDADLSLFKPRMAVMVGPTDADLQYFFDADGDGVWNRAVRVSERDGEPRKVLRAEAFVDGKWVRTPEFEGRPRVSLAWLGVTPSQEERVFNLLTEGRPTLLAAEAIERRGPNPGLPNVLGDPDGLAVAIKGAAKTGELTLELQGDGFMGIAVTTAVKGPAPTSDALVRQLVKGTVRFAFLWLATDNGEWAMYDWNTDGKVDLAMMSTKADGINFALTAKGAGFVEGAAKGAFLQWKGFKAKPMQKAVREALVGAFEPKFIEAEK